MTNSTINAAVAKASFIPSCLVTTIVPMKIEKWCNKSVLREKREKVHISNFLSALVI